MLAAPVCCAAIGLTVSAARTAIAEPPQNPTIAATSPQELNLLAANSLADWNRGSTAPTGWTLQDGKLTGTAKSSTLVSSYTLRDFELQVAWKVTSGANIKVGFPSSTEAGTPESRPIEIRLAEQPGISIRLPQGAKILKVDPELNGKLHRLTIKRTGGQLVIECDGVKSREMPVSAAEHFGLSLAIEGSEKNGSATIESLRLVAGAGAASAKLSP